MPLQVYNSFKKEKEPFQPLRAPKVNIYTCGVTVYDECHIGHARSLYIFDVIRRYLQYKGYKVNFVRNITDIDDKIINRARLENKGEPFKDTVKQITDKYIKSYYQDLELLGIQKASFEPRATENIPEMVKYIQGLIDKGYAYITNTGVYFSVRKFKDYGKLSHQSPDQMLTGVRKEPDETKNDPLDFALWKLSKPDEPKWPSPWGEGRPGWHIECSVMSQKFLKTDTLDIHAGGLDLIFPHHENEIAQAEALTGKPFAKYWIHHGLLTINGQKMAKSLGNFITIKDFMDKYKDADILKLFFLSTHYSHPVDFTDKKIKDARKNKERIIEFMNNIYSETGKNLKASLKYDDFILRAKDRFINTMDNDFNMPRAFSCIFDLIKDTYEYMKKNKSKHSPNYVGIIKGVEYCCSDWLRNIFSLESVSSDSVTESIESGRRLWQFIGNDDLSYEEQILIENRAEARNRKDFVESDKIRIELKERNIVAKDTKEGSIYQRKS